MAEVKFYKCKKCGLVVFEATAGTCTPKCCGEPMALLKAGETDGAREKHVPAVTREGDLLTARVGEVDHPMLPEHFIQWVAVDFGRELHFHRFEPGEEPTATFAVPASEPGEEPTATFAVPASEPAAVYEYCNLHGLWKAEA